MNRVVIGVGNPARGDDGVGVEAVRRLGAGIVASSPFEMIDLWSCCDDVVVIDAARSGAPAGTIHRFDLGSEPLPAGVLATSTHSLGVGEVVELARTVGRLPKRLMVYGIEAGNVTVGTRLTPEVEAALGAVMAEVAGA